MTQSVGVLALRLWWTDQGELKARVMSKLDVSDSTTADISYPGSMAEVDVAVATWLQAYVESTSTTTVWAEQSGPAADRQGR